MTTSPQDNSVADYYFDFLRNLNADSKLDLISKLSLSLKEEKQSSEPEVSLHSLFGAYQSDETAEEIIAALRAL
jgi:hypothetical protein